MEAVSDSKDYLDVRQILRTLWRRRGLMALAAVGALGLSLLVMRGLTPQYTGEAIMVVNLPQGSAEPRLAESSHDEDPGPARDEPLLRTHVEILRSQVIGLQVVRALDLAKDPEFNSALRPPTAVQQAEAAVGGWLAQVQNWLGLSDPAPAAGAAVTDEADAAQAKAKIEEQRVLGEFLRRLSVENDGKSFAIRIFYQSPNATRAAEIVNKIAETYISNQIQAKRDAASAAAIWLDRKLAELREKQRAADQAVQHFRERLVIADVTPGGEVSPLSSIEIVNLSRDLTEARAARAKAEAELHDAEMLASSGMATSVGSSSQLAEVTQGLRKHLGDLMQRRAQLGTTYDVRHPEIQSVEAQITAARSALESEVSRIRGALKVQVDIERNREEAIQASMDALENDYQKGNRAAIELRQLEAESTAARSVLMAFLTQSLNTSAQLEVQQADARLLALAEPPQFPSFPNKRLLWSLAIAIAAVLSLIAVVIAESLDSGLRDSEEVEQLFGLPVLGMIPRYRHRRGAFLPMRRSLIDAQSAFAESVRAVGTVIRVSNPPRSARVILVTSALPREGKTTFSISLAHILAAAGEQVLLVDCDLRRPALSAHFGATTGPGLAQVLDGSRTTHEALRLDADSGIRLLPAGESASNAITRLDNLERLLNRARAEHDVIILDAPPVGILSDPLLLAQLADSILLAVQWGMTPRAVVRTALRRLRTAKVQPLGIVLTKVDVGQLARYRFEHDTFGYLRKYTGE